MIRFLVTTLSSLGLLSWRVGWVISSVAHVVALCHELGHKAVAWRYGWATRKLQFWPNPFMVVSSTDVAIPTTATTRQRRWLAIAGSITGVGSCVIAMGFAAVWWRPLVRPLVWLIIAELVAIGRDLHAVNHRG